MNEQSRDNEALTSASTEQDVLTLIRKMQQQLSFLEKKIDILISQSQAQPSSERPFSKPFRPSGRPYRRFDSGHGDSSAERSFERGRHFEKRHGEETRGFEHKKRSYDTPREGGFSRERHFEKRHSAESRGFEHKKRGYDSPGEGSLSRERHFEKRNDSERKGFDPRKKPFSYGRKERR